MRAFRGPRLAAALWLATVGAGGLVGCLGIAGNFDVTAAEGPPDATTLHEAGDRVDGGLNGPDVDTSIDGESFADSANHAPDGFVSFDGGAVDADSSSSDARIDGATAPDSSYDADAGFACAPEEFHCQGAILQICNPTRDGWIDRRTCASLCDDASALVGPTCTGAALCDTAAQTCDTCVAGQRVCTGSVLQVCVTPSKGFTTVIDCGDAGTCNPGDAGPCVPPPPPPSDAGPEAGRSAAPPVLPQGQP